MAHTGDCFTVKLTPSQLGWGTLRYTNTREKRYNESYLSIPKNVAIELGLFNSNHTNGNDVLGENIFNCTSSDGLLNCQLKSQGCSTAGDEFAKQFAGNNSLCTLSEWYSKINANDGDEIEVYFISPTEIRLTYLKC